MNNTATLEREKVEQVSAEFTFNESKHAYLLDGKPLTGVTTILGVIAKPNLIQWAANLATAEAFKRGTVPGLKEVIESYEKIDTEACREIDKQFIEFKEARTAHCKRKKDAGTVGTDVHAEIEKYVKLMISDQGGQAMPMNGYDNEMVRKFVEWAVENKVQFLASERRLYSREHWYAGTVDLVMMVDGKKMVGDIKTSGGIYGREYFFQMAGYQIALEENGETDFVGSKVIRCGKDGSFEVKDSFDLESDKAGFLAALRLYRELEK